MSSFRRVLAVLVDAADPGLVLDLIERGELPVLARLREEGSWSPVRSPAHIGNAAVYSTFFTGSQPERHGVYGGGARRPEGGKGGPARRGRPRPLWGSPAGTPPRGGGPPRA